MEKRRRNEQSLQAVTEMEENGEVKEIISNRIKSMAGVTVQISPTGEVKINAISGSIAEVDLSVENDENSLQVGLTLHALE